MALPPVSWHAHRRAPPGPAGRPDPCPQRTRRPRCGGRRSALGAGRTECSLPTQRRPRARNDTRLVCCGPLRSSLLHSSVTCRLPEDVQKAVEAIGSRTYNQERQGHPRKRQVELVAPIGVEEAVLQVHREYRDDHHPDKCHRCQRRQEAQYYQYPADKLRESGQDGHGLGRLYTQLLEHLREARDPRPAEATEELLGTMTDEDHTKNQPQHQQPYVDHFDNLLLTTKCPSEPSASGVAFTLSVAKVTSVV